MHKMRVKLCNATIYPIRGQIFKKLGSGFLGSLLSATLCTTGLDPAPAHAPATAHTPATLHNTIHCTMRK